MPRRAASPQYSLSDLTTSFASVHSASDVWRKPASALAHEEVPAHATRVLAQAHQLWAQIDIQRCALQQCLALLQTADPEALFFYCPDSTTLTPAPSPRPKARKAWRLQRLLTKALRQAEARLEALRLNTLLTISRLGLPVAVWHFLIPGPLPLTLAALLPRAAPPASPPVSSAPPETTSLRPRRGRGTHNHKLP